MGMVIALGVALLVGVWFPRAKVWVFLVISIWWGWVGFKYAVSRDFFNRQQPPHEDDL